MEFHVYKDTSNQWRWRLRAQNNKNIAVSGEGYYNKQDCLDAIALVKQCGSAPVKED